MAPRNCPQPGGPGPARGYPWTVLSCPRLTVPFRHPLVPHFFHPSQAVLIPTPPPPLPGPTPTWAAVLLQLLHVASSTPLPGAQKPESCSHTPACPLPSPPHRGQGPARAPGREAARPRGRGLLGVEGAGGGFPGELRGCQDLGACGGSGTWLWWGGAYLWKTRASTVMAASRRKASAPRMDPTTKESLSGS